MKSLIILIVLLTAAAFSQTPNWTNVKETNITVGNYDGVDIFTNRDGNHIIVQNSSSLKYYKMNINGQAGSPITLESTSVVTPSISGDATRLYVVYRKSNENYIRTKYSSDGGSNWSYISTLNYNANSVESVFSNNLLHVTYEVANVIYYASYNGLSWTTPVQVSTTGQNGHTPRIAAYYYSGNDFVYFMYRKSNSDECKWRKYDVKNNSWGTLYTGFSITGIDSYSGFRVDGSNIVIYFIWHEQDPWQYYFAWVVLDLNNNFLHYGNSDLSIENWRMYSTQTADGKTHTVFYFVQFAGEDYSDIGLWRSNSDEYFPTDEFYEYELPLVDAVKHLNLSSAGNEVHVIWKDPYGSNGGNNLRYKYDDQTPLAPTGLTITKSANNHPLLSWNANLEPDRSYYQLYRWDSYGGGWQPLAQTSNTSYEDATLTYCTAIPPQQCPDLRSFQFKVTAVDFSSHESAPSNIVESRLVGGPPSKVGSGDPGVETVLEYSLSQNYPNPFNPTTTINYSIKTTGLSTLKVYDMLGVEVASLVNENQEAGNYSVTFNASELPSGIYFYTLTSENFMATKKLILLK
jgi:hypothetical protein